MTAQSREISTLRRRPKGFFSNLQGALKKRMTRWTFDQGGPELERTLGEYQFEHLNEFGLDPYGLDPEFVNAAIAPFIWLYKNYFRVETTGAQNIPAGRVFLCSNHSGQIPMDGAMIGVAAFLEAKPPRIARALFEKFVPTLPYISIFFSRLGQVVGTPENCRRLLEQDEAVMVFPEGARGISKTWAHRYQLEEFGLGFMRLALETNTPIVPIAVIGAEEQVVSVANLTRVGKFFGMPSFPIIPQMLIPGIGLLPMPTKYRIYFGEPLIFEGNPDDEDAEIEVKVKVVRDTMQGMIQEGLRLRKSVFF